MTLCAACGIGEDDGIKLKTCTACKSVRYCGIKCQRDHRPQHKKECKKRAAELHDEILFKQPESTHMGDCPICFLPLSVDPRKSALNACCSKIICQGCAYADTIREMKMGSLQPKCLFCRQPTDKSIEEARMKRIEANDPVSLRDMGDRCRDEKDYQSAVEYWTKAAALGDAAAHYNLSISYQHGLGVEKDKKKAVHHLEQAAIGGDPWARHNLGCYERVDGRHDRAAKHWIIAAKLGYDDSLENVKKAYRDGFVGKTDLASALRGHQAAVDAMKSPHREAAEVALR